MSHSPNISEDALNALHDHQIALAKRLDELEQYVWYATDILLTCDDIFKKYGPPNAPSNELRGLLDTVKDYLLTCPSIDTDLHNLPLPRPPAPGGVAEGEAAAPPGPGRMPSPAEIGRFGGGFHVVPGQPYLVGEQGPELIVPRPDEDDEDAA